MPRGDVQRTAATSLTTAATAAAAVALGFTSFADAQNLSSPTTACPRGLNGPIYIRGQSCYQFNGNEEKGWTDAQSFCHQRNGRLVAVTDSGLQSWLSETASTLWPNKQGVWLGLNRVSNTFVWDGYDDTAQTGNYFNWVSGYPTSNLLGVQNCVYMRRSYNWGWANIVCDVFTNNYNYICEYRMGTDTTTSSVTEYYSTTSRGFVNQTADNATFSSSRSALVVPLSAAAAALVVVLLIITALLVYLHRRRRRFGKPNIGNAVATGRSTVVVQNPLYAADTAELAEAQPNGDVADVNTDGRHWRPPSNVYADMGSEVASENKDQPLQDPDTGPLYAEPFQSQPSSSCSDCSAATARPTGSLPTYHQYTYVDVAPLLKSEQEAATPDTGPQDYEAVASPVSLSKDAPQDGYEPFQSQWNPYENVTKPDLK